MEDKFFKLKKLFNERGIYVEMEDKFFKLKKLFNERGIYVEMNAHRKDQMESYKKVLSLYNDLIKGEVLRLAEEFTKAEVEVTNEEST